VIASAAIAMALGTYAGGWRIIRTLGKRIAHLEPHQGFAAETATAGILYTTAYFGFPVSTTHTISGSVLGAGAARRFSAVRWGIAGNILVAWLLTMPAAASVGALMEQLTRLPGGEAIVLVLAALIALSAFAIAAGWHRRWWPEGDASALLAPPA
jgi:inorganic phosphate transporter, PiT family